MISLPIWLFVCMCVFASIPILLLLYIIMGAIVSCFYDIRYIKEFYEYENKNDEKD